MMEDPLSCIIVPFTVLAKETKSCLLAYIFYLYAVAIGQVYNEGGILVTRLCYTWSLTAAVASRGSQWPKL